MISQSRVIKIKFGIIAFIITLLSLFLVAVIHTQAAVTLMYFKVEKEGNRMKFTWETASEMNNAGFYIERSENGVEDYQRITLLGKDISSENCDGDMTAEGCVTKFIFAMGDTVSGYLYQNIYDINVESGKEYFYRLVAVDAGNQEERFTPAPTSTATQSGSISTRTPTRTATITRTPTRTPVSNILTKTPTRTATITRTPTRTQVGNNFKKTPTRTSTPTVTPRGSQSPTIKPTKTRKLTNTKVPRTRIPAGTQSSIASATPTFQPSIKTATPQGGENLSSTTPVQEENTPTPTDFEIPTVPMPSITLIFPDTATAVPLITATPAAGTMPDNASWFTPQRLVVLGIIAFIWVVLGGWFFVTIRKWGE